VFAVTSVLPALMVIGMAVPAPAGMTHWMRLVSETEPGPGGT